MSATRTAGVLLDTRLGLGLAAVLGALVVIEPALAALALLGAGFLGAALAWPPLLVVAMYAGMLFDRLGVTGAKVGDFPVTASKLSVLAGVGLWGLHVVLTRARPVRWHRVLDGLLGMMAVTAVCIAWSNSMAMGKFTLYGLGMMTVMVALVYAVLAEADLAPLYRLLTALLLAVFVVSIREANVTGADGRVSGPMGDPNEWATTVLLVSPLLLGGLVGDDTTIGRALRLGLVLLAPLAVLRSESRAALAVGALLVPFLWRLLRARRGELGLAAGAAVLAAPFLLDLGPTFDRFVRLVENLHGGGVADYDSSLEERSELFRQGVQLFADHWLIGAGPGNFETATGFVSHEGSFRPAHNTYLEIASEQGVLGLSAALVFGALVVGTVRGALREAPDGPERDRVYGAGLGLAAFALMAATLGLLTFAMAYLVLGATLALTHQARRTHAPG